MSDIQDIKDTIQRCPHDSEHPYAQILNEILRHKQLSIESIWMLSYLLSNSRNWKIKIPQIVNHVKGRMGRDKVYKTVQELIKFGYMQRITLKNGNRLAGYRYFISEIPKFKNNSSHTGFQETEGQDTENTHTKEQLSPKKKIAKEQQQGKVAKAPVIVPSSSEEEREEQADKAATQYIKSKHAQGQRVNEPAVRRRALKEGWKPNETDEDVKESKAKKAQEFQEIAAENKEKLHAIVEDVEHLFTREFRIFLRENVVELKSKRGACPIPYADKNCVEMVYEFINKNAVKDEK